MIPDNWKKAEIGDFYTPYLGKTRKTERFCPPFSRFQLSARTVIPLKFTPFFGRFLYAHGTNIWWEWPPGEMLLTSYAWQKMILDIKKNEEIGDF